MTIADQILLGNGASETGFLNLSDYGTLSVGSVLQASRANGTSSINITGGNLTLDAGSFELAEFAAGTVNFNATLDDTGFSTLNVGGLTSFGEGDSNFNLALGSGFSATLGDVFTIIDGTGFGTLQFQTVAEFSNVTDGQIIASGDYEFEAAYTGTGEFTLEVTAIPEPTSAMLLLLAGGVLFGFRRR